MNKIFIAPRSGEQISESYHKTENGGYKFSEIKTLLTSEETRNLSGNDELFFWGNKPNSKSKWEKIETGDYILFYAKRKIVAFSKIIYKTKNPKLAEEIWGWTKTENGNDVLWEYLYFFEKPVSTEISFKELTEYAGYSENYVIQGFTPYSIKGIEKIISKYSDIDNFLNSFNFRLNNSFLAIDFSPSGLIFNENLINRYISSLLTKPFVILTGLSGSGKTKLAQAFAMWMSESKQQYALVPVGADWTNREPLLGYPNSLKSKHYVMPDSGVLDILIKAHQNYSENNGDLSLCKPYFLILDEMNLSHVERYFADFLSAMESGDEIKLYSDSDRFDKLDDKDEPILGHKPIPNAIRLPKNLFIIGTVNIDETTYMFSPKVLDRANTIEFRISKDEMAKFLEKHEPLKMENLLEDIPSNKGKGAVQTKAFMELAARKDIKIERQIHQETFVSFFKQLQLAGTEFGYRTANEMTELVTFLNHFSITKDEAYDIAIMQKLLPKLNGSRSKLSKVLPNLGALCLTSGKKEDAEKIFNEFREDIEVLKKHSSTIKFLLSFEKLSRMHKNAQDNGFASYAEA